MLVKLLSANYTTPSAAYVTAQILTNASATQNLTSITLTRTLFTLSKMDPTTGAATALEILADDAEPTHGISLEGLATAGIIRITFDATATSKTSAIGDILCLTGGSTVDSTLGVLVGPSTMDTGITTVSTSGQDLFVTAPTLNRTSDINYHLQINSASGVGSITFDASTLDIVINGVAVAKITLTLKDGDNKFNYNELVDFTIKYLDSNDNVIQFDGSGTDTISLSLIPV